MKKDIFLSLKVVKSMIWFFVAIFLLMCLFVYIEHFHMDFIQNIDNSVIAFIKDNVVNKRLTSVMIYITDFGDYPAYIIILLLMFIFLNDKLIVLFQGAGIFWVFAFNRLFKYIFERPRPVEQLIPKLTSFSFPSAHSMCAIAFYGLLIYFLNLKIKNKVLRIVFSVLFSLLILIIAFSRLYLNVHYLSDILVGLLLGGLCLIMFIFIYRKIQRVE